MESAEQDRHDGEGGFAQPALEVEGLKLDRMLVAMRQLVLVGGVAQAPRQRVDEREVAARRAERRLEVLARERKEGLDQVMSGAEDDEAHARPRLLADLR